MRRAFTLIEIIIVIIIVGILAAVGLSQYSKSVEKGRTAEAKAILGQLRVAQMAYKLESGVFAATMEDLSVNPPSSCAPSHWFEYGGYWVNAGYCNGLPYAYAWRCSSGGKSPNVASRYVIRLKLDDGTWCSDAGY